MTIANKFARRLCTLFTAFGLMLGFGVAQAQTVIYYHTDALGSPVATTNAAGVVIERTEYEPYGQVLNGPVKDGPGYTGHVSDAQTGLSYMQQRYYDPQIGRFLSLDPVTADTNTGGNFNRYRYAANNPYRFVDPDGRQEHAAERFGETYNTLTPGQKAPLEAIAIPVTTTLIGATPVIGPFLALSFRQAIRDARQQQQPAAGAPKGDPHAPGDAPNGTVIVRGGTGDMPAPGTTFSGSQGNTVTEAGAGVPHGTIRTSTAGEIRGGGGRVEVAPEPTRSGQINGQHVNVTEGGKATTFSPPRPNPVPKPERVK